MTAMFAQASACSLCQQRATAFSSVSQRRAVSRSPVLTYSLRSGRQASRLVVMAAGALSVGDKLQDYPDYYRVLQKSNGGGVALSSLENKKPIVLFFYPKAGTPGCTKEACKFRDEYGKFVDAECEVFGISSDTTEANAAFAKKERLPFPLLTDQSDFLRKSFGIKGNVFGMLKGRQTFVIDKEGKCVMSFNDQMGAEKHVEEALQVIKTLA
ncbi:hypothetical protein ABBQ32_011415 [Trebouxia sp. C0010 RCD-2024]